MSKFQAGDKVKVIKAEDYYWYNNHIGEIFTLMSGPDQDGDWRIQENTEHYLAECDIELVCAHKQLVQEKEMFDMKTNPWFIRVNSKEEFEAAKEWVKSKGIKFRFSEDWYKDIVAIETNGIGLCIRTEAGEKILKNNEIKLTFKTVIDSVEYPVVKSEQQKKVEELEATIAQAQTQLAQLKQQINKGE